MRNLAAAAALFMLAAGQSSAATLANFGSFTTAGFVSGGISGYWADGALGDFDSSQSRVNREYVTAAVANLATGSLHASASAFHSGCNGLGSCDRIAASATASLRDRYVFTNTGDNIALIPVSLRIDGHCAGNVFATGRFKFGFSLGGPVDNGALPYRNIACGQTVDLVAPINLVSFIGDTSYYAYVELEANAMVPRDTNGFSLADFGDTLKIDILLPEGVTARSESGVFPFRSETAVPEPGSWSLMILGFAGAGHMLRRRRAQDHRSVRQAASPSGLRQ